MFKIGVSNMITQIVESLIDRKTVEYTGNMLTRPCIGLGLSMHMSYHKQIGISRSKFIYFLFCGNTNVFVSVQKWPTDVFSIPLTQFTNTSNHDSCWRDDGVNSPINDLYFTMAKEVISEVEKYNSVKVAPAELEKNVFFMNHDAIMFGSLTYGPESDSDSYRRKIISLTKK